MTYNETVDLYNLIHTYNTHNTHNTNSSCPIEEIGSCAIPLYGSCPVPGFFSHPISCPVGVHTSCEDLVMTANDNTTLVTFKHNDSTGKFDLSSVDFIGNQDNDDDWYRVFKLISQNTTVQYSFTNTATSTWYTLSSSDTLEMVDYYTSLHKCGWPDESLGFNPLVEETFELYFRVNGNDPFISMSYTFTMNDSSINSTVVIDDTAVLASTKNITNNIDVLVPLVAKIINNALGSATKQGLPMEKVPTKFVRLMLTQYGNLGKTLSLQNIVDIMNAFKRT